jgi:uncharacterized protein (DUF736 family)
MNYDNNNSGALFKNDKEGNESRPDYRGSAEINRVEYWVSAWIKTSKGGSKYMSLRFEPKQASQVKGGAKNPPAKSAKDEDFNDDIPL